MGPGLYVASDIVTSMPYGTTLLILPIKPHCEFAKIDGSYFDDDKEFGAKLLNSSVTGIVYDFSEKQSAIVLRGTDAIDLAGVDYVDTAVHTGKRLAELPAFVENSRSTWKDVLRHYGALMQPFVFGGLQDDPLGGRSLEDFALHSGFVSEVLSLAVARNSGLLSKIDSNKSRFPLCSDSSRRMKIRGTDLFACAMQIGGAWIANQAGAPDAVSLAEAQAFFQLMGALPSSWTETDPEKTRKKILEDFRKQVGAEKLSAYTKALKLAMDDIPKSSMTNWKPMH